MISIMYFRFLVDHGYYRDIVYRNNLKNTIKTYRDITFSIIAQPTYIHIIMFYSPTGYVGFLLIINFSITSYTECSACTRCSPKAFVWETQ